MQAWKSDPELASMTKEQEVQLREMVTVAYNAEYDDYLKEK